MEYWKFLINRLLIFIGMIGSFIGATLGYYEKIVEATGKSIFNFFLFAEAFGLVIVFLLIIKTVLSFIKTISKDGEDEHF